MGKFKEMNIEAQDAVISDYDAMYEVMPVREPTDADLRKMQVQASFALIEEMENLLGDMLDMKKYYDRPYTTENIETVISVLKDLKRTLQ